jgi:putative resolvase
MADFNMLVSIGMAALMIGVSVSTLRRWEKEHKFLPDHRTIGGHRRYSQRKIAGLTDDKLEKSAAHAIAYARVSSHDQKRDLESQKETLEAYAKENFHSFEVISDLGSGLNYRKPGLKKLLKRIHKGDFSHLILNHKDRLLRFGSEIIFSLCRHKGIEVLILEEKESQSFEMELSSDVIELMTVFSAKLYGRRSHQNRRKKAA